MLKKYAFLGCVVLLGNCSVLFGMEGAGGSAFGPVAVSVQPGSPIFSVVVAAAEEERGQIIVSSSRELVAYHDKTLAELARVSRARQARDERDLKKMGVLFTLLCQNDNRAAARGSRADFNGACGAAGNSYSGFELRRDHECVFLVSPFSGRQSGHGSMFKAHCVEPVPMTIDRTLLGGLKESVYRLCLTQMAEIKTDANTCACRHVVPAQRRSEETTVNQEEQACVISTDLLTMLGYGQDEALGQQADDRRSWTSTSASSEPVAPRASLWAIQNPFAFAGNVVCWLFGKK